MRTLKFLLQKEFRQIMRSKVTLITIVVVPIIQLIILPQAANFEVKNIKVVFVDHDHSSYSKRMIAKVYASRYFSPLDYCASYKEALRLIEQNKADIIVEIPQGFENNLVRDNRDKLFFAINGINGMKAIVGSSYLNAIITDFNKDVRLQWHQPGRFSESSSIELVTENWYNPYMNYFFFMVPGIMVMLLTVISAFSSSLNIVKEKEIGTIEQINVTPVKKYQFILGKLIPYWVLGMVVFTFSLAIAHFIYGVVPIGNIGLLYSFLSVYLFAMLGAGLLISTYSETQQQAMSLVFFFVLIFILISGIFTPIDSMPGWAKVLAYMGPVSHFAIVMRMVILKGSSFNDILPHFMAVLVLGVVLNVWAVINYRKTT